MTKATNSRCATTRISASINAIPSSMRPPRCPLSGARIPRALSPCPLEQFEPGDAHRTCSERQQYIARMQIRESEHVAQAGHIEHACQDYELAANHPPLVAVRCTQRGP